MKIVINSYNKKNNIFNSIMLLMDDIWKLYRDLHIYDCHYTYRKTNKSVDFLVKKGIYNLD